MGLVDLASERSRVRGLDYYEDNKVQKITQLDDKTWDGLVAGSVDAPYQVHIDLEHPRSSSCTCKHAAGRRVVCKHMIALCFTAVPDEAEKFKKQREEEERRYRQYLQDLDEEFDEERRYQQGEHDHGDEIGEERWSRRSEQESIEEIVEHVYSLSETELRMELLEYLIENELTLRDCYNFR